MAPKTIQARINGEIKTLQDGITLKALAELYRLNEKSIVFELNHKVIDRGSYSDVSLHEQDTVEIVHLVGGG